MRHWNETRLTALSTFNHLSEPLFCNLPAIIRDLGFDFWCYIVLDPFQSGKVLLLNTNWPALQVEAYLKHRLYIHDPRLAHGLSSLQALHWKPSLFAQSPSLWQSMCDGGGTQGMTQACHHSSGLVAMLCLCRAQPRLEDPEFEAKVDSVLALAYRLTVASVERIANDEALQAPCCEVTKPLTRREVDILQKTAVGHTAAHIAVDMFLSERTVQFHISRAITKLDVPNKTAAVAQAILLGLVHLQQGSQ